MTNLIRVILLAGLVVSQSGCGTVVNLWLGVETGPATFAPPGLIGLSMETRVYGGLQNDIHGIGEALDGHEPLWWCVMTFFFFTFIDFPLCLVADTLTLPYTIPYVLTRPDPEPSKP